MSGDSLNLATEAFLAELSDFFPDPRVRAGLKKTIETSRQVVDHMITLLEKEAQEIDVESEARKLSERFGVSRG